ncbi:neurotrypsin [Culex quinquefasciatus]|uniref:Neurotrypsin n=1 Tax=Culex quinquefasciatus TaxID=7176 RepID=B0WFE2_CULQU|nr:neurotrypsin [Culex quinquefasciatus]|eukprot:XP_001847425.1 neurotrypsin [Culex quinquefasciatus]
MYLFLLLFLGISSALLEDKEPIMFPNERTTLDDCHLRYFKLESGEVGPPHGTAARFREFAHMAAIGWTDLANESIEWQCGGSLIWDNFVLTAAHCAVDSRNRAPDVVRLGDLDLFTAVDDAHAQQFGIVAIVRHPEHRFAARYHDIALLKLDRNVRFTLTVSPACLWADEEVRFPTLTATGWGNTGFAMKRTPNLLKVTLKPIDNKQCSEVYTSGDRKLRSGLQEQHICAVDEKMDTCEGDSGGPLQVKLLHNSRMSPFLVGVTSFGITCGASHPGVYTRVSFYHDWIVTTMRSQGAVGLEENYNATLCALRFAEYREFDEAVVIRQKDHEAEIDGTKMRILEVPTPEQMVQIGWTRNRTNHFLCSGSILNEEVILTTASCLGDDPPQVVSHHHTPYLYRVGTALKHPAYNATTKNNDIALIQLRDGLSWSSVLFPACLWTNSTHTPIVMKMLFLDQSDALKLFTVHPMYNSDCQRTHPYRMPSSQLCVRDPGRNTTCVSTTDQAVWLDPEGVPFLVGLTPHAGECVQWRYSVLTRISSHLERIGGYLF